MSNDTSIFMNPVMVLFSRKTKSGRIIDMSMKSIDLFIVKGYNKWQNWSIDEIIKQEKYKYEMGDTLIVRFWNYYKNPFCLSNVEATLSVGY